MTAPTLLSYSEQLVGHSDTGPSRHARYVLPQSQRPGELAWPVPQAVLTGGVSGVCLEPRGRSSLWRWPLLQLQVGVEFEASTRMQDTSVSFGYQLDLPKANLLFKGKGLSFPPWKTDKR